MTTKKQLRKRIQELERALAEERNTKIKTEIKSFGVGDCNYIVCPACVYAFKFTTELGEEMYGCMKYVKCSGFQMKNQGVLLPKIE